MLLCASRTNRTSSALLPASPTTGGCIPGWDAGRPGEEEKKWRIWRQQAAAKCWYRIQYEKTGDMAFLGHLDFQRQMQLALRRSGLPVAYSKGYHPHPLMKFGPPLPVGVAGEREVLDLALAWRPAGQGLLRHFLAAEKVASTRNELTLCYDVSTRKLMALGIIPSSTLILSS